MSSSEEATDTLSKSSILGCLVLIVVMICSAALVVAGTWKIIEMMQR